MLSLEALPDLPPFEPGMRRAPKRPTHLSPREEKQALSNALRYVPAKFHAQLAPEFYAELKNHGRIYGYRFRPRGRISAKPIDAYEGRTLAGRACQLMMDNNLDFEVALYPYELVTYGETGQVCSNWMQYLLIQEYLRKVGDEETLVVQSGHPLGIFPSQKQASRVVITNALMIGMYDNQRDWERAAALGVANYGSNDCRWMDVHRTAGHCARNF